MSKQVFIIVIWVLFLLAITNGDEQVNPKTEAVIQLDETEYRATYAKHKALIGRLVSIVEDSDDTRFNGRKHLAIRLLGAFRAEEAIPVLLKNLTFLPTGEIRMEESIPTEMYYPAVRSLTQIGYPCVNVLLAQKIPSADEKERHLALWVIRKILGQNWSVIYFGSLAESSTLKSKADLYRKCAEHLKSYRPTSDYPGEKWPVTQPVPLEPETP